MTPIRNKPSMKAISFKSILKKYKSGWLALTPNTNKVVASGKTLNEVIEESKKRGVQNPTVFKPSPTKNLYIG